MHKIFNVIFSGSNDISLNFFFNFKKYFKFYCLLTSCDFCFNFNIFKIFFLKKNFIYFQFKNIFFYNNFFYYNIYFFIKIRKINTNISIIFNYGFIFSVFFLKKFYYGFFNIHVSILPFLKGPCPILLSFYNKNFFNGISFIFINKYFDAGKLFNFYKFYFFDNLFVLNIKIFFFFEKNLIILIKILKYFFYFNINQFKIFLIFNSKMIK